LITVFGFIISKSVDYYIKHNSTENSQISTSPHVIPIIPDNKNKQ
jgi:hypothetical protein